MDGSANADQTRQPGKKLWYRIVAAVLAVLMLLSLFILDAVRIKLGRDAKTETEKESAEVLAENADYMDASTMQRVSQWMESIFRSPETFEDYYRIATVLIAQGEYERAQSSMDAAIRLYDGGDQAVLDELYMKQGSLHAMNGAYGEMEKSFAFVSEGSAYEPQKLLLIAQAAIERNDSAKAVINLERYLEHQPNDTKIWSVLAQLYMASGAYGLAAGAYDRVIDAVGDTGGELHYLRGTCYMEAQMYAAALDDFLAAEQSGYPDVSLCDAQIALCSFLNGKYEDCLTYGEKALAAPSDAVSQTDLYYFMGLASLTLGDYEASRANFCKALALDDTRQDVGYYLAVSLMALEKYDEAIERFTALIGNEYSLSLCYYNRALCYISKRSNLLAKADLERVVEMNEDAELTKTAQSVLDSIVSE